MHFDLFNKPLDRLKRKLKNVIVCSALGHDISESEEDLLYEERPKQMETFCCRCLSSCYVIILNDDEYEISDEPYISRDSS
jgi:hypothetical protein